MATLDTILINMVLRNLAGAQDTLAELNTEIAQTIALNLEQIETQRLTELLEISNTLAKCVHEGFGMLRVLPYVMVHIVAGAKGDDG